MSERIVWVVCYDIANDRTRGRFARYLEERAVRVQKSVFEARLDDEGAQDLRRALVRRLDPGDSLRMYALPQAAVKRSLAHGGAPLPEEGEFWIL